MSPPEPFVVNVPDATLVDLRERLLRTRWPGEVAASDWTYGASLSYIKELAGYWLRRYDWRSQEASLNRFHHYRARVDGHGLHFIHERGKGPHPLPLLLAQDVRSFFRGLR
ncbi:MAG: hypothetical protein EXR60_06200 [Dehalococcoidia bacterium]|nr:hypothetical protein [Dehalococcoidia bacterium]